MIINHNMNALNAHRNMNVNNTAAGKSMEKLSSGLRINRAGDDAAGLAISEKMRGQIRGLEQSSRNAADGISMIQTAEGALNETQNILQRMRELSVQSSNDTNTTEDREAIQKEIEQLSEEVERIGNNTAFNKQNLIDGSIAAKPLTPTNNASITSESMLKTGDDSKIGAGAIGKLNALAGLTGTDAKLGIEIDGKKLEIDLTYDATDNKGNATNALQAAITGANLDAGNTDDATLLGDIATGLKTDINNAIANYNKAVPVGEQIQDVEVKVVDGRFVIESGSTGTTGSVKFDNSEAAEMLGLAGQSSRTQGGGVEFQVGANANQTIKLTIGDMRAEALGVKELDLKTKEGAQNAIDSVDAAIKLVSSERANLGAVQNRLEYTISNLDNTAENLTSAESTLRDVDMAKEMMEYSKNNILNQAAQAMISQANQQPQNVLQLLR